MKYMISQLNREVDLDDELIKEYLICDLYGYAIVSGFNVCG